MQDLKMVLAFSSLLGVGAVAGVEADDRVAVAVFLRFGLDAILWKDILMHHLEQ